MANFVFKKLEVLATLRTTQHNDGGDLADFKNKTVFHGSGPRSLPSSFKSVRTKVSLLNKIKWIKSYRTVLFLKWSFKMFKF